MKSILRSTTCFGLFILLNICITGNIYGSNPTPKHSGAIIKNIDFGCIIKQLSFTVDDKNSLLIKSKKFVFYINRKKKHVFFVSNLLAFSKGDFELN